MSSFGGGSSGPTLQQQQEMTQQGLTEANLNLEENSQRKSILNSMLGTRVFRGSALSRAMRGNTPGSGGEQAAPAPSASQLSAGSDSPITGATQSLLDQRQASASGATPAGGTGASGIAAAGGGVRGGGSGRGMIP